MRLSLRGSPPCTSVQATHIFLLSLNSSNLAEIADSVSTVHCQLMSIHEFNVIATDVTTFSLGCVLSLFT
jgi:hypothetical protein